jgi:hypothetical protein
MGFRLSPELIETPLASKDATEEDKAKIQRRAALAKRWFAPGTTRQPWQRID